MIQAVTFDLWQTLILETPEDLRRAGRLRISGVRAILKERGYDVPSTELERAYEVVGRRLEGIWRNHVDISPLEQVQLFLDCVDPELPLALGEETMQELEQAYTSPVLTVMPALNEGAAETLTALKGKGLKIGLICNTGRTPGAMLRIVLERLGILPFFNALAFSNELRLRKPDPRIFILTLEQLGVKPEQALHVGDDPQTDVGGAKGVQMHALWLKRGEDPHRPETADGVIGSLAELLGVLHRIEAEGGK